MISVVNVPGVVVVSIGLAAAVAVDDIVGFLGATGCNVDIGVAVVIVVVVVMVVIVMAMVMVVVALMFGGMVFTAADDVIASAESRFCTQLEQMFLR